MQTSVILVPSRTRLPNWRVTGDSTHGNAQRRAGSSGLTAIKPPQAQPEPDEDIEI